MVSAVLARCSPIRIQTMEQAIEPTPNASYQVQEAVATIEHRVYHDDCSGSIGIDFDYYSIFQNSFVVVSILVDFHALEMQRERLYMLSIVISFCPK